jgi:hypothetical protein
MNAKTAVAERTGNVADFALPKGGAVALVPEPTPAKAYPPNIVAKLMKITREFGVIAKATHKDDPSGGWNSFHNYGYQKWDDVLARESKLLCDHGLIIQQSEVARSLLDKLISISYEFTIIDENGDVWPDRPVFTAIGRLQDNKGIFDDKAANKCHTQAHKYFLLHTFKIKTKETAEDDADSVVPDKQEPTPAKPPRPGSAEAKKLDEPREINANGAQAWADAFIGAIERAGTIEEIDIWCEANKAKLAKLEQHEAEHDRATKAIADRRGALRPKPPKPGTAAAPAAEAKKSTPMPDPTKQPAEFIVWLKAKYESFTNYEDGETYWNNTIEALDLRDTVFEDAMAVWQAFEAKHAP